MGRLIDLDGLARFSAGSRVFATGAAESSFNLAVDWARSVLGHGVELLAAGEPEPDTLCVAVSLVGSTTALGEQLPFGDEPERAVRALERRLGERAGAVVALNLAAENALIPLVAAARLGVPLVDGDGSGRVFPLLEQTTYALGGLSPAPVALAGGSGRWCCWRRRPTGWRSCCVLWCWRSGVGGGGVLSDGGPRPGPGGGAGHGEPAHAGGEPGVARSVAAPYGVRALCRGRILAVEGSTGHGTDLALPSLPSSIVLRESEGLRRLVRLEAHNEIVLALADGAVVATVPDLICMVSTADEMVVDVDKAEPGLEVDIMVVRAAPVWHTARGLALGGPRAFGIPL
ncbi:DUF917 domain-containing protein [Nonomuraea antimicrobica]